MKASVAKSGFCGWHFIDIKSKTMCFGLNWIKEKLCTNRLLEIDFWSQNTCTWLVSIFQDHFFLPWIFPFGLFFLVLGSRLIRWNAWKGSIGLIYKPFLVQRLVRLSTSWLNIQVVFQSGPMHQRQKRLWNKLNISKWINLHIP